MTDRELLEVLVEKVTGIDDRLTKVDDRLTGVEKDLSLIKTQLSEHGEILQSVRNAQEVQSAQIDQLTHAVTRVEGRQEAANRTLDRMAGDVSYLLRKAADHDDDIRELRQAK